MKRMYINYYTVNLDFIIINLIHTVSRIFVLYIGNIHLRYTYRIITNRRNKSIPTFETVALVIYLSFYMFSS